MLLVSCWHCFWGLGAWPASFRKAGCEFFSGERQAGNFWVRSCRFFGFFGVFEVLAGLVSSGGEVLAGFDYSLGTIPNPPNSDDSAVRISPPFPISRGGISRTVRVKGIRKQKDSGALDQRLYITKAADFHSMR